MAGTFFGILAALALIYHPIFIQDTSDLNVFAFIFALVATLLLVIQYIASILAWAPIQRAEEGQTPHIFGLYEKDTHLKYARIWLHFFAIFSFLLAIHLALFNTFNKNYLLALWLIFFGLSLDCLHYYIKRISDYLNPILVVDMFAKEGIRCIQNERDVNLCGNIDALCEIGIKGIQQSSSSLTSSAVDQVQKLTRDFLEAAKSIAHPQEGTQPGIQDRVPYTLFYTFQRLDLVDEKATEKRMETICSDLVTALGKMTLYAAKYDIPMAVHPLYYLNQFAQKALRKASETLFYGRLLFSRKWQKRLWMKLTSPIWKSATPSSASSDI